MTPPWVSCIVGDFLKLNPGKKVLVIGFGYGALSTYFSELVGKTGRVFGIEVNREHLEKGRKIIAKNVADSLKKLYPNNFVRVTYPEDSVQLRDITATEITYFNDCENNNWHQGQTLTDENSYAGKYSSKINQQNQYSITFNEKISNISYYSKRNIIVSFYFYKSSDFDNAKLVLDIEGEEMERYWTSVLITPPGTEQNNWNKFEYKFINPSTAKEKGDAIKIYCMPIGNSNIYIDDFKIRFNLELE